MTLSGKIISFLAISIIVAHAIIPHVHHSDIPKVEHAILHQGANSIFDYIALAFHSEQQGGELEEFVQEQSHDSFDTNQVLQAVLIFAFFSIENEQKIVNEYIVKDIPIKRNYVTDGFDLRGPPSRS